MRNDYLHDGGYRMKLAVRKLDELQSPNKGYALAFKRKLDLEGKKERTIARRLHEVRHVLKILGKDAKKADKADIEELVLTLNRSSMAPVSRSLTKLTIKTFFKNLLDFPGKRKYPEIVDWITTEKPKNSKTAADLLTQEEMVMLIGACKTPRDKAVIAILSTFGCRVGELLNLKYRDVELTDKETSWIAFDGKTGYRRCPFTSQSLCHPYLVAYLNEYRPKGSDAPLFTTKGGLAFDYKNVRRLLQLLKKWTGLEKRLHPHIFRFSAATEWSGYISESLLKNYMGWTADSKMAGVYIKSSDKLLAEGIMRATGQAVKAESRMPAATKECIKCHRIEPITNIYCSNCGSSLDTDKLHKENFDIIKQQQELASMRAEILEMHRDMAFIRARFGLNDKKAMRKVLG